MIELNYRNIKTEIIGEEHGLDIEKEFCEYKETIRKIIAELNSNKDKPGQKLQWMNLG